MAHEAFHSERCAYLLGDQPVGPADGDADRLTAKQHPFSAERLKRGARLYFLDHILRLADGVCRQAVAIYAAALQEFSGVHLLGFSFSGGLCGGAQLLEVV